MKWAKAPSFTGIKVGGADRFDFMQRLSTQNVKTLAESEVKPAAFLNANGTVVSIFWMKKESEFIHMALHGSFLEATLAFFQKFHFSEDLTYEPYDLKPLLFLNESAGLEFSIHTGFSTEDEVSEAELFAERAWRGLPTTSREIGESNIISEAIFADEFVHPNKGCYPGQEVVERIRTYGNVAKRIVRINLNRELPPEAALMQDGQKMGTLNTVYFLNKTWFGLATIKRLALKPGAIFTVGEEAAAHLPADF